MLELRVDNNIKAFTKRFTRIQRKQIPFATANALNDVAFDGMRAVKAQLPRYFIIRNTWTARGVRVRKARKTNLESQVYFAPGRGYIARQITGGVKTSRGGRHVAIPQAVRPNAAARINKGKRPAALLKKPNAFVATIGGTEGIWLRPKRGPLKLMYVFKTSVVVRARFPFSKIMRGVVTAKFDRAFGRQMQRALRTAR